MDIYKAGVLMTRAHIEKVDKWVLMEAIGEDVSYEKVKSTLLSLFGEEEVKKEKEVWITGSEENPRCYTCHEKGHSSPENKDRLKQECERCKKAGHSKEGL